MTQESSAHNFPSLLAANQSPDRTRCSPLNQSLPTMTTPESSDADSFLRRHLSSEEEEKHALRELLIARVKNYPP
jgi:hypothetical protein